MVTAHKTSDESSAEIVRSFIATWNKHNISATMELLDPDIEFRSPLFADPVRGIEARKGEVENFLTSMPDFEFKLIRIATDGDFVATELVGTGTSTGPAKLPGPGTHKPPTVPGGGPVENPADTHMKGRPMAESRRISIPPLDSSGWLAI